MKRHRFYFSIVSLLLLCGPTFAKQPNIVVVMTDDQGYPEVSAHGNPVFQTPNLDALHRQSLRLTDFHVAPMCAPTRGQLLTGLDAARNGCINVSSGRALLRPEVLTMGNIFGEAGYATGIFGKWHLVANYPFRPENRGFQRSVWFPSSHIGSVPDTWGNDYFDDTYVTDGKPKAYKGYCTDVFFDEAMSFMKQSAAVGKPFLAYIATNTPHGSLRPKEEDRKALEEVLASPKFADMSEALRRTLSLYLGMVRNIDTNVGRLIEFLHREDLRDDTIVAFLTHNGSTHGPRFYNAGMRGMKTDIWDGGHHVPCFISWPNGGLASPQDIGGLTQVQDLLPTLVELCGLDTSVSFDGTSLASVLHGKANVPEDRTLIINYSRMPNFVNYPTPFAQSIMTRDHAAVLWKRWRLLEDRELYNLETDPLQQTNVIAEHPGVVKRMRDTLYRWWDEVGPHANTPQRIVIGHDRENPARLRSKKGLSRRGRPTRYLNSKMTSHVAIWPQRPPTKSSPMSRPSALFDNGEERRLSHAGPNRHFPLNPACESTSRQAVDQPFSKSSKHSSRSWKKSATDRYSVTHRLPGHVLQPFCQVVSCLPHRMSRLLTRYVVKPGPILASRKNAEDVSKCPFGCARSVPSWSLAHMNSTVAT